MKKPEQNPAQVFAKVAPLIRKAYEVMTSDPEECVNLARKALRISRKASFSKGIANGHMHIGLGMYHQGDLAEALQEYIQAEGIFLEDDDVLGLRSVYNNIGVIYIRWKDREKALEYFQKNLALSERLHNPRLDCTILANLGSIHMWSKDIAEARECFQKSLASARAAEFKYGEANTIYMMGDLYMDEGNYEEANRCFQESRQIREEINDLSGIISINFSLSELELHNADRDKALAHLEAAMDLAGKIKNKHYIALAALKLAEQYRELGKRDDEKKYLELCIELATEHSYRDLEIHALHQLANWYEKQGDFQRALEIYWQYQKVKDFLTDQHRNDSIQQLRVQMQVREKERELGLVRGMNKTLERKNRQIIRQKNRAVKAEKALLELNQTLEQKVKEEVRKRQKQEQLLIQKSKLESLGRMAAGIAHEVNQPLGVISLAVQNLINKITTEHADSHYIADKSDSIQDNIERIRKIIDHVRLFSRDQQATPLEPIDVCQTIQDALALTDIQSRNQNISIITALSSKPLSILGNRYRLEQVILNLISNAKDALDEKYDVYDDAKRIAVKCHRSGSRVLLEIEDNGIGMEEQVLSHIYDPFFTTKSESHGTGLGLSICYGIVRDMNGSITCHSHKGEGTVMRLEFDALDMEETS
jgi:signal transduction histidine kinase